MRNDAVEEQTDAARKGQVLLVTAEGARGKKEARVFGRSRTAWKVAYTSKNTGETSHRNSPSSVSQEKLTSTNRRRLRSAVVAWVVVAGVVSCMAVAADAEVVTVVVVVAVVVVVVVVVVAAEARLLPRPMIQPVTASRHAQIDSCGLTPTASGQATCRVNAW